MQGGALQALPALPALGAVGRTWDDEDGVDMDFSAEGRLENASFAHALLHNNRLTTNGRAPRKRERSTITVISDNGEASIERTHDAMRHGLCVSQPFS